MRVRNKPWANEKLANYPNIVIAEPEKINGNWQQQFGNCHPIHIEIGTGKGQFITEMALAHSHINFIGIEKFRSIVIDALDKVVDKQIPNVKLLNLDAQQLLDWFAPGEITRLYLNFSDPWPKNRHEKRRLTHESFLHLYQKILKQDGEVHLKTDNQGLFEYSLESFSQFGLVLKNISLDLHQSEVQGNIMTEYEEKFSNQGKRIYRCEAVFHKEI